MIEKKIISSIKFNHSIENFLRQNLKDVPIENVKFDKTPLGEKITIVTSTPGLVIGKEGAKIEELTNKVKEHFKFEKPQIKIEEVKNPFCSAKIVAKMISNDLTRFGSQRFKLTAFKYITKALENGARGIEIKISGKLPSSRAKSWRFTKGYLKKTGYASDFLMEKAIEHANLSSGTIGVKVMILSSDIVLPDKIDYLKEEVEEISEKEALKRKRTIEKTEKKEEKKKETKKEKVKK